MKSIKTASLAALLSAGLITFTTVFAAPPMTSDGYLILTVEQAPIKKAKSVKQTKKVVRSKRPTRAKRSVVKRKKTTKSKFYRVKRGDTLTRISIKTGIRFSKLVRLNRLYGSKKNRIDAGQRLRIR